MSDKKYYYSEIFYSIQGEGKYTGVPTVWLRYFLCNLQCNGFGQINPTDPDSYDLPYQDIDVTKYERMEDLPVFERGCDSSYSWNKKFKPLQHFKTASEITDVLIEQLKTQKDNSKGLFSAHNTHLCFTGGEPLMKHAQECTSEILTELRNRVNRPPSITFETNGTHMMSDRFLGSLYDYANGRREVFFSVSPKLWTVAGEHRTKAIKPEVLAQYYGFSTDGQLKFVCNGEDRAWNEIKEVVDMYREAGCFYPVWIMPVGATIEGQEGEIAGHPTAGDVASEALRRGYRVSARVHTYLWGNKIGT